MHTDTTHNVKMFDYAISFFPSVTNKKLYEGSSSPWPPFRLPTAMLSVYNGLRKLLHCRTMHGLIFVILYKVELVAHLL